MLRNRRPSRRCDRRGGVVTNATFRVFEEVGFSLKRDRCHPFERVGSTTIVDLGLRNPNSWVSDSRNNRWKFNIGARHKEPRFKIADRWSPTSLLPPRPLPEANEGSKLRGTAGGVGSMNTRNMYISNTQARRLNYIAERSVRYILRNLFRCHSKTSYDRS
jgi:hypothetical protein